jgi:hypothetical protein
MELEQISTAALEPTIIYASYPWPALSLAARDAPHVDRCGVAGRGPVVGPGCPSTCACPGDLRAGGLQEP